MTCVGSDWSARTRSPLSRAGPLDRAAGGGGRTAGARPSPTGEKPRPQATSSPTLAVSLCRGL